MLFTYTSVGLLVAVRLLRAMREASDSRTVKDTESYAFLVYIINAKERMTEADNKQ